MDMAVITIDKIGLLTLLLVLTHESPFSLP